MKLINILFTLFISINSIAQINIDSLTNYINDSCIQIGFKEYLLKEFKIFENHKKSDQFHINTDSLNQLEEYIGLAVVHYKYDTLSRLKLIEGFGKNGDRRYWDFPVRQTYEYKSDTISAELNKIRDEICNCKSTDTLSFVKIRKEYYNESKTHDKRVYIWSNDSTLRLTYVKRNNKFLNKSVKGCVYIFREYDPNDLITIKQERFYDINLNLINGDHKVFLYDRVAEGHGTQYAYSIRDVKDGKITCINFYDKSGKLIDKSVRNQLPTPIGSY